MGGKGVSAILEQEGYNATKSPDSEGPWDVIGTPKPFSYPVTRVVQSKSNSPTSFRPSTIIEAIEKLWKYEVGFSVHREVWLWIDGEEWVVRVGVFDHAIFLYDYLTNEQTGTGNKWVDSIYKAFTKKYPKIYCEILKERQDWTDYTQTRSST